MCMTSEFINFMRIFYFFKLKFGAVLRSGVRFGPSSRLLLSIKY